MLKPTELMPYTTIGSIVDCWNDSYAEIVEAARLLNRAEARLKAAMGATEYGRSFSLPRKDVSDLKREPAKFMEEANRDVWLIILNRAEVRRFMSAERCKQLDKQLSDGEMPPIDAEEIRVFLGGFMQNMEGLLKEAVNEVYGHLRPERTGLKTNERGAIGSKVILTWIVEEKWNGGGFSVRYGYSSAVDKIRAIDTVFHRLDGEGMPKTYNGPLGDAIDKSSDGHGETEYFRFRAYKNGNLHLEFKRPDLLAELNRIAGAGIMPGNKPPAKAKPTAKLSGLFA